MGGVVVTLGTTDQGKETNNSGGQKEDLYFSHICNFKGERIE